MKVQTKRQRKAAKHNVRKEILLSVINRFIAQVPQPVLGWDLDVVRRTVKRSIRKYGLAAALDAISPALAATLLSNRGVRDGMLAFEEAARVSEERT